MEDDQDVDKCIVRLGIWYREFCRELEPVVERRLSGGGKEDSNNFAVKNICAGNFIEDVITQPQPFRNEVAGQCAR